MTVVLGGLGIVVFLLLVAVVRLLGRVAVMEEGNWFATMPGFVALRRRVADLEERRGAGQTSPPHATTWSPGPTWTAGFAPQDVFSTPPPGERPPTSRKPKPKRKRKAP